jgi:hypothetical protein
MTTRSLATMKPQLPQRWSYTASVRRMKSTVWKWKRITAQMIHEVWVAHEMLTTRADRHGAVAYATETWEGYCDAIGLDRTTAWRWLQRYDPAANRLLESEHRPRPDLVSDERMLKVAWRKPLPSRRRLAARIIRGR